MIAFADCIRWYQQATLDVSQLAKLLDLPSWEDIDELNMDYYWECVDRDASEEEAMEQEFAARDEVERQWRNAVMHAAEQLLGEHGLELQGGTWEYQLVPTVSWRDAANQIRQTINGVGYFHFGTLAEFLESGPYTAREAVLSHLGYVSRYPEVYGTSSARSLYEASWR